MKKVSEFCNKDCRTMHQMGIPLEKGEWMELGYFMRTISHFPGIADNQKKDIQQLLVRAFRNKDFLPEQYLRVVAEIEALRHFGCTEKAGGLEDVIDSMSRVITGMSKEVNDLTNEQASNISHMDKTAELIVENVRTNRPSRETLTLVSQLKSECRNLMENVSEIQRTLKEEAMFDTLTKLYNRRAFDRRIKQTVESFKEKNRPLSLIMIDIDNFKTINDTYGHQVGDQVLAAVSGDIQRNIRKTDHAARYGGDEMVVIFDFLEMKQAEAKAKKIRESIESHEFFIRKLNERINIAVSIGVSECHTDWCDLEIDDIVAKLISDADAALYKAKESGRNRVCAITDLNAVEIHELEKVLA